MTKSGQDVFAAAHGQQGRQGPYLLVVGRNGAHTRRPASADALLSRRAERFGAGALAECTDEAHLAHVRASIEPAGTIGVDGGVSGAKVLRGAGFGLDESALAAFSQWKFRPARQGGHPVETKVVVVIPFRCSADALAARIILELPPGASRPVLRKGDVGLLGSVFGGQSLMLEITEFGTVASNAALPDAARALLAG